MGNCLRHFYRRSGSLEEIHRNNGRSAPSQTPAWYLENDPVLHPAPGVSVPFSQLTEDQQVTIAMRMALIASLPVFIFDGNTGGKSPECVICMCEYVAGDELRKMPMCPHVFHRACIDDWLTRSLTCPSCLQEVSVPSSPLPRTAAATASATAAAAAAADTIATSEGDDASASATAVAATASGGSRRRLAAPPVTDLREEARRIKRRAKEHLMSRSMDESQHQVARAPFRAGSDAEGPA